MERNRPWGWWKSKFTGRDQKDLGLYQDQIVQNAWSQVNKEKGVKDKRCQGLCRPWEVCIWWEDIGEFARGGVTSSDLALREKKKRNHSGSWAEHWKLEKEDLGMGRVSTEAKGTMRGNCRSTCNRQELLLSFPLGYNCIIMLC